MSEVTSNRHVRTEHIFERTMASTAFNMTAEILKEERVLRVLFVNKLISYQNFTNQRHSGASCTSEWLCRRWFPRDHAMMLRSPGRLDSAVAVTAAAGDQICMRWHERWWMTQHRSRSSITPGVLAISTRHLYALRLCSSTAAAAAARRWTNCCCLMVMRCHFPSQSLTFPWHHVMFTHILCDLVSRSFTLFEDLSSTVYTDDNTMFIREKQLKQFY